MGHNWMLGLTSIVVLGTGAQWLAWRLRVPSILLLLTAGTIAGPITGFLDADALLGPLLLPIVSLSVAVILFEGGLNLDFRELKGIGGVFLSLSIVGVLVTWGLSAVLGRYLLRFDWSLAALLGAVLVVTGPTVIGPLLRHLRLGGQVGTLLKWEGIVIDPVGAMLAVAVFSVVRSQEVSEGTTKAVYDLGLTILAGGSLGLLGAAALYYPMRKYWIPDALQNPITLAVVFAAFTASNWLQAESGLLAVTVMGIALAAQRSVPVHHVIEFKENLTVLLLAILFIILSARLRLDDLKALDAGAFAFVLGLIVLVRPLAVFLATLGSPLSWAERMFLGCMAPRGIVAAAVTSVFALEMTEIGFTDASRMVPVTFLVVFTTVLVYGLSASPIATRLKLAKPNPQGVLIVGGHVWSRAMALALHKSGCSVLVVDSDWGNVCSAQMAGVRAHHGSILADRIMEEIELTDLGRMLAVTSNNAVNSLACLRFREVFGRKNVYQLAFTSTALRPSLGVTAQQRGRLLFDHDMTYYRMVQLAGSKPNIQTIQLTKEYDYKAFRAEHATHALPLFLVKDKGEVSVFTPDNPLTPMPGHKLIYLQTVVDLPADQRKASGLSGVIKSATSKEAQPAPPAVEPTVDPASALDSDPTTTDGF